MTALIWPINCAGSGCFESRHYSEYESRQLLSCTSSERDVQVPSPALINCCYAKSNQMRLCRQVPFSPIIPQSRPDYLSFHQRISSLSSIFNFHNEKQCESAIFFPFGLSWFHPFMRFKTSARVQLLVTNLRISLNYLRECSKHKRLVLDPHAAVQCAVTMINGDSGWRLLFS